MPEGVLNRATVRWLIGASLIGFAHPAFAQAQSAPAAQPAAAPDTSGDIIVTAQKRSENIKDVPFGITAIGDDALVKNRVQSVGDIARLVPSLDVGVGFGREDGSLTIRGVAPQTFNSATVVTFVDGFTTGLRTDVTADLFDLERVEVLEGPQATLYGRNAIGGTINYITKKPTNTWQEQFQAVAGNYRHYAARAAISGPIVGDVLTARLSASTTGREGYFDDILTGQDHADAISDKSARLALRLKPAGPFESNLALSYSHSDDACGDCVQSIKGFDYNNPQKLGQGDYDLNDLNRTIDHEIPTLGFKRSIYTGVWTNALDLGGAALTSITGYSNLNLDQDGDENRLPGPLNFGFAIDSEQVLSKSNVFSEELRLASNDSGRFTWLIGGYFYRYNYHGISTYHTPFGPIAAGDAITRTTNLAAFANGTYAFTDRLKLTLGLRYDYERTGQDDLIADFNNHVASHELLPRASLLYSLSDHTNLYATVSRGYHSGGVNTCSVNTDGSLLCPPSLTVGPEFVWNYEAGLKGAVGRTLSYSLSGYYIDWTDQQVTSSTGFLTYLTNSGTTHIYGLEGALHAQVTPRVRLDVAANYLHSRYADFLDESGVPTFYGVSPQRAGERTLLAPDFSGTATLEYRHPLSGDWDITADATARYTGTRALDTSAVAIADGYTLADFSLSIGKPGLRVTGFLTNAFNKDYATYLQLFGFPGVAPLIHAGAPREFGLQLDTSF